MNLVKKMVNRKAFYNQINENIQSTYKDLKQTNYEINKLNTNITALSALTVEKNEETQLKSLFIKRIIENLKDFRYSFNEFKEELNDLMATKKNVKLNTKTKKTIKLLIKEEQNCELNFLDTYSMFLVKCKLSEAKKQKIMDIYIEIIKELNLNVHTNEK